MMEIDLANNFCITCNIKKFQFQNNLFQKFNLPKLNIFQAFSMPNKVYGCTLSHMACVNTAMYRHMPYVVIFEDDAYPRKDILEYSKKALANLPPDWDVLKIEELRFRAIPEKKKEYFNEYWFTCVNTIKTCGVGSAAYIINSKFYDKYVKMHLACDFKIPADCIFNKAGCKLYFASKMWFLQHMLHGEQTIHQTTPQNTIATRFYRRDDIAAFKL